MIDVFKDSFYSIWFANIPDSVICKAIEEVELRGKSKSVKSNCRRMYDEWIILNTVKLLMTFFDNELVGEVEIKDGDKKFKLKLNNLSNTGEVSTIKKDVIDMNISREYFKPKIPEGFDISDFPHGSIKTRIHDIYDSCTKSTSMVFRTGSNL